jgi:hypothetical protein
VRIRLDVRAVPNEKTALVWGTLPGATNETIYVMAHRDGWFDAATDNASGVATMIGLAEYYANVPQARRRRTMVFIGLDGHHNSGTGAAVGGRLLLVEAGGRPFALPVDAVRTVLELADDALEPAADGERAVRGFFRLDGALCPLVDLAALARP